MEPPSRANRLSRRLADFDRGDGDPGEGTGVAEHRLEDWEAAELAQELTSGLVRRAYKIDQPHPAAAAA